LDDGWTPDIIHCHDWMIGLIPQILPKKVKTVFTIHNLQFQGPFDYRFIKPEDADNGKENGFDLFSDNFKKLNSMERGIIYADLVTTVSERYAKEILTPEFGCGLDNVLQKNKHKLYGVLNGLDYRELNPATDRHLRANYGPYDFTEKKRYNKKKLQEEMGLEAGG
ncbi:MAG: glycogen/starch synthase, partial [Patescibacteria group bacterium]